MQTLCSAFSHRLKNANCSFSRSLFVFGIAINIVLCTSYRGIIAPWDSDIVPAPVCRCAPSYSCSSQRAEDGLAGDVRGVSAVMLGGRRGRRAESPGSQISLWIPRNSSPPPRLLWEASGACRESEVRRGLSGTKLQIHMICLAKRVKEKWIKAWRDQRSATIESRRLPWDQQEMHIIYKLFSGSVRCARGLIVIVWRKSSCWRGVKSKG